MPRNDKLDLINKCLFTTDKVELSAADQAMMERVRAVYALWLEKPTLSEKNLRDFLIINFKISRDHAMRELSYVRLLLGNVSSAGKEFYRYKVNILMDQAAAAAEAGNHSKAKSLAKIAEIIIKNNRTDQDDGEKIPYEDIVPIAFEMSCDPAVVGVHRTSEVVAKAERLRKKYMDEVVKDVEFATVEDDGEE